MSDAANRRTITVNNSIEVGLGEGVVYPLILWSVVIMWVYFA